MISNILSRTRFSASAGRTAIGAAQRSLSTQRRSLSALHQAKKSLFLPLFGWSQRSRRSSRASSRRSRRVVHVPNPSRPTWSMTLASCSASQCKRSCSCAPTTTLTRLRRTCCSTSRSGRSTQSTRCCPSRRQSTASPRPSWRSSASRRWATTTWSSRCLGSPSSPT